MLNNAEALKKAILRKYLTFAKYAEEKKMDRAELSRYLNCKKKMYTSLAKEFVKDLELSDEEIREIFFG